MTQVVCCVQNKSQ